MITIKSLKEIEMISFASKVVAKIIDQLKKEIQPGTNGLHLNQVAEKIIKENNCESNFKGYYGFPAVICVSINEQLVHGIPNNRIFKIGDLVSIDVGCKYNGYHADAACTVIVGQNKQYDDLLTVTENALNKAIAILKPGIKIGDISNLIQTYVESKGYQLPRDYTGHGIGLELHEEPSIPNVGKKGTGPVLMAGMVICIEPMVQVGTYKTKVLKDGWTVVSLDKSYSAHFEHTILITDHSSRVLTKL